MIGNAEDSEFTGVGEGEDAVDGGAGDDLVDGGDGVDDLEGGAGSDVLGNIDASAGMPVDLTTQTDSHGDTLAGFEGAWGSLLDDVITGTDGPNELVGVDGSDQLSGLGGDELLIGGFFTPTSIRISTPPTGAWDRLARRGDGDRLRERSSPCGVGTRRSCYRRR